MTKVDKLHQAINSKENNKNIFYLLEKANSKNTIRVLYKQVGKVPRVRIVPNVQLLKRAIISNNLTIIPYQNVYIICNNSKYMEFTPINVVFDFFHISGDLLVVQINKKTREFESLSQEDILWFTKDLEYKSYNNSNKKSNTTYSTSNINDNYFQIKQRTLGEDNIYDNYKNYDMSNCANFCFETELLKTLSNINLALNKLSISNTKIKKGTKNNGRNKRKYKF